MPEWKVGDRVRITQPPQGRTGTIEKLNEGFEYAIWVRVDGEPEWNHPIAVLKATSIERLEDATP